MSTQPEALRLADELCRSWRPTARQAAVALRALHETLGRANALLRIRADRIKELEAEVEALRATKDGAYEERNRLVALLAALLPSVRTKTAIEGWSEDWHGCIYITLPNGQQASWHYHDSQAHLFEHVVGGDAVWDGHTTPEKYERIAACCAVRSKQCAITHPG